MYPHLNQSELVSSLLNSQQKLLSVVVGEAQSQQEKKQIHIANTNTILNESDSKNEIITEFPRFISIESLEYTAFAFWLKKIISSWAHFRTVKKYEAVIYKLSLITKIMPKT